MAKKELSEKRLAQTVAESAHEIWLAGLGAFAKAQQEGTKVFDALVREGELLQARTKEFAGDKLEVVTSKATGTWDRLEKVFEQRVEKSLKRLGVPTARELEALTKRVEQLHGAVQALLEKAGAAPKAPARRRKIAVAKAA